GRSEAGELPEPVERAVHGPVGEARERGGGDRARQGIVLAHRAPSAQQRRPEPDDGEQCADQTRLEERAQLYAVGVARRLVAVAMRKVLLLKVVHADAEQRMAVEFVQRHAIEVVAIAAKPPQQAVAAGGFGGVAGLEAFPAVANTRKRVAGDGETADKQCE